MLPDPRLKIHPQVDNVVSKDEVMVNNKVTNTNPTKSEKLEELGEKITKVEKPSKVKGANDVGLEKRKKVEEPLTKIYKHLHYPILDDEEGRG